MKRKPLVGISMKMYFNSSRDIVDYASRLKETFNSSDLIDVFLLPSIGTLYPVSQTIKNSSILFGSQNMAHRRNGALTGEFSIESLIEMRGRLVEIGHYERRSYFHETDDLINKKVRLALDHEIIPIICIGEPENLSEEAIYNHINYQIETAFEACTTASIATSILAYEPYWAIGKSQSASPSHIHRMHKLIRNILIDLYSKETAESIRIIYGGSVSKDNAGDIIADDNVDGLFVGRFGHDVNKFMDIVQIVRRSKIDNR